MPPCPGFSGKLGDREGRRQSWGAGGGGDSEEGWNLGAWPGGRGWRDGQKDQGPAAGRDGKELAEGDRDERPGGWGLGTRRWRQES